MLGKANDTDATNRMEIAGENETTTIGEQLKVNTVAWMSTRKK